MRVLLLMRGAPGSGKSTFIDKNGLRPYALSADEIRLQCQSSQQTVNGKEEISCNNEKTVWKILFTLLEVRMQHGEFTVIDATNSKTEEMNRYKQMADTYRYRMFCVDLTGVPIEECKKRNAERPSLKRVPDSAIDKMYSRFKNQKIPSRIKAIKPNELDIIWMKQFDMSEYDKVVHIGDIHGCYTALKEYLDSYNSEIFNGDYLISDKIMFIFLGDFIDRGIENVEVMNFMFKAATKKNVLLLEGNHERWLQIYGNGGTGHSKEFELRTKKQFEEAHLDRKEFRKFYRKLGQCAWYKYDDKEVFVSHAGIATLPENLTKMATSQLIKGVGRYDDFEAIADTWMNTTNENQYQIYGHRNTKRFDMKIRDRVYNLEGDIEFGGYLRIVELSHKGFNEVLIKNNVFRDPEEDLQLSRVIEDKNSVADEVLAMRQDKRNIREKNFGHLSSFNFTRDVFYNKDKWNNRRIKARGLYIDVDKMKVAARSFDKFFNINEMPFTQFDMLHYTMQFPVTAYVKENGFLGLIAYDEYGDYEDNLLITTKSSIEGDYSVWLRDMLKKEMPSKDDRKRLSEFLKSEDVTMVVECVDMEHDPHIIEYPESHLYLLAIVKNDLNFTQYGYEDLLKVSKDFGLLVKEKAYVLKDWQSFFDWYTEITQDDYTWNDRIIEGFVIEDSVGFMTKVKLNYYKFWKHMRSVAWKTLKYGTLRKTSQLYNDLSNEFYSFCQDLYNSVETKEEREELPRDIITLRNMFMEDREGEVDSNAYS